MRISILVSVVALEAAFGAPAATAENGESAPRACLQAGAAKFFGKSDTQGVVAARGRAYAVELRGTCLNIKDSWGVSVDVSRPGAADLCDMHDGALTYADANVVRSCRVQSVRRLEGAEAAPFLRGGPKAGE